jgi:hypothetical protein
VYRLCRIQAAAADGDRASQHKSAPPLNCGVRRQHGGPLRQLAEGVQVKWLPLLVAEASVATASCAVAPLPSEGPCRADGGCSHDAVQARVTKAFAGLEVSSFIECVSRTTDWCSSGLPDEDACLVLVQSDDVERYTALQNATPPQRTNFGSHAVNYFSGWLQKPFSLVFVDTPARSPRERFIYSDADGSLAVLLSKDVRCVDVSEITSAGAL